jgi:hypothetical protein
MKCFVCGKTEDDVAKASEEMAETINRALKSAGNDKERDILLQRKKSLDKITFTHIEFSAKARTILEKYLDIEQSTTQAGEVCTLRNETNNELLICMHCKWKLGLLPPSLFDTFGNALFTYEQKVQDMKRTVITSPTAQLIEETGEYNFLYLEKLSEKIKKNKIKKLREDLEEKK